MSSAKDYVLVRRVVAVNFVNLKRGYPFELSFDQI